MNTQEESRNSMAKLRKHEEHIQDNLLHRAEEQVKQSSNSEITEEARELIVKQHQHDKHIRETMLSRSEAEIDKDKCLKT